ncbi:FHA domain-containing protein [Salsipaludibacter albus]|uniref:FHA domain-containing protein n=1 Tax=Salsipaludibacter albus TaxID=2849650 RepID=UPI001EE3CD6D|nr:FHA domain-containing protein [Salsipaludibacter albus]MBY5163188.1 FHA domain-containing protein [Salsipaludibacter albus]
MTAVLPTQSAPRHRLATADLAEFDEPREPPRKAAKVVPCPILYVTNGPSAGRVLRLELDRATIGRDRNNAYVLDHPSVSRIHARLQLLSGVVILTDLGSSTGTWVDDEPATTPTVLSHGAQIRFGPVELVFENPVAACRDEEDTEVHEIVEEDPVTLSPRKMDVVRLLAEGLTNAEIADRLGLAELTIKSYTDELYRELDVHSRAAAVAEAIRLGLL